MANARSLWELEVHPKPRLDRGKLPLNDQRSGQLLREKV
jgi:hypothetical protein